MSKTWHPIPGFEGRYWISRGGRVRNRKGLILTPMDNGAGYLRVDLYAVGCTSYTRLYVHRLVAEVFVPNPHGKPEVNHKNKNTKCNRASNLEWVTRSENECHKIEYRRERNGRRAKAY